MVRAKEERLLRRYEFAGYYANLPFGVRSKPSWLSWDDIYRLIHEENNG